MRCACEIRRAAREALGGGRYWPFVGGNFLLGVLSGLLTVVPLIVVTVMTVVGVVALLDGHPEVESPRMAAQCLFDAYGRETVLAGLAVWLFVVANLVLIPAVYACGFMSWGQSALALAAVRRDLRFEHAMSGWGHGWKMGWVVAVQWTYLTLWFLLFFPVGLVKLFSYVMTPFVAVEHPDWSANACITASRQMMAGRRWRFFCLHLSFIGWWLLLGLLSAFGGGVATLFFMPYPLTASAVFYDELKRGREAVD